MPGCATGGKPPVLPNYLGLTVGGTLSVGGIGVTSIRHGAQVDQVLDLQVVTGEGDLPPRLALRARSNIERPPVSAIHPWTSSHPD